MIRLRPVLLAALAVCVLSIRSAAAAVPQLQLEDVGVATPENTAATCTLEPGPISPTAIAWSSPYAWQTLAWRIPSGSCQACPAPQLLNVTAVRFRVRYVGACGASAQVSIVGATGNPQCPTPDPNQVLCGPVDVDLTGPANTGVTYEVQMPEDCCVFADAFVLIEFRGMDACSQADGISPGLSRTGVACTNCQQYARVAGLYPNFTEWCSIAANPIWLQVDANCCSATPSRSHSWGRVKTLYR